MIADEGRWKQLAVNECGWREMKPTGGERMRMNVYEANWGWMIIDEGRWRQLGLNEWEWTYMKATGV